MKSNQFLLSDDIIVAIFNYFPDDVDFSADREQIHTSFFEMKTKYPKLFSQFTFDTDNLFPTSKSIDQSLSNLEMSKQLGRYNPALKIYEIKPPLRNYFNKNIKNIFKDDIEEIKNISQELFRKLDVSSAVS